MAWGDVSHHVCTQKRAYERLHSTKQEQITIQTSHIRNTISGTLHETHNISTLAQSNIHRSKQNKTREIKNYTKPILI